MERKTAAYREHITRMHSLPLTLHSKQKEWATIQLMAQNNNFLKTLIQRLNHQIQRIHTDKHHTNNEQQEKKTCTTFTYYIAH